MSDGWSTLKHRDFALVCGARFVVTLAVQMVNLAIGWYLYDVTNSPLALGYIGLAGIVPTFALVLVTGYSTDRIDRRLLLTISAGVLTCTASSLLVLVWQAPGFVFPVYIVYMVASAARAFFNPAAQAIIPRLVPREDLSTAVAFSSGAHQAAQIAGPALGGILYAIDARLPFATGAVCCALAAAGAFSIRHRTSAEERRMPVTMASLLAGFRFIWQKKVVLGAVSLDMMVVMFGGVVALLPVFARDILHTGPWGLGLLRAAPAAGAVMMALWVAHSGFVKRNAGARLFVAVAIYGAATAAFGLSSSFIVSLLCLVVVGAADMVSMVIRHTMVQGETPDDLRGRVAGVNTLFTSCSGELGQLRAGVIAWLIAAPAAVVVGGVGAMALAVLWPQLFRDLRDRDHLVNDEPQPVRA